MANPASAPNPNVPQIPQPVADVGSLAYVAQALKQAVDSLAGNRGSTLNRAVTFNDLISLGLTSQQTVQAPGASESYATTADLTTVENELASETTARVAGDANLQTQVNTVDAELTTLGTDVTSGPDTIKGNNTGSSRTMLDLTPAQVKTLLAIADTDVSGKPLFLPFLSSASPPLANQVLAVYQMTDALSFPANFGALADGQESVGASLVGATGSTTLTVQKCLAANDPTVSGNWSAIGTAVYGAGGHAATLSTSGGAAQSLAQKDYLRVIAPSSPDATLASITITLVGTR